MYLALGYACNVASASGTFWLARQLVNAILVAFLHCLACRIAWIDVVSA